MNENVEVFSIHSNKAITKKDKQTVNNMRDSSSSKEFRFVNNSPNSMTKPRNRMKPTFKVLTQQVSLPITNESVIIEQTLNKSSVNDKKYVFQLNVKRPPGRPRKHPIEENKIKRPQGRPRKYPIEVSGSSIVNTESSKIVKKSHEPIEYPIDTQLELASSKRGRGRPKREKDGKDKTAEAAVAVALNESEQ